MTETDEIAAPLPPGPRGRPRVHSVRIRLSSAQFHHLVRASDHRGVAPNVFLDRIIATILDHNLINAVLDDERESK